MALEMRLRSAFCLAAFGGTAVAFPFSSSCLAAHAWMASSIKPSNCEPGGWGRVSVRVKVRVKVRVRVRVRVRVWLGFGLGLWLELGLTRG